MSCALTTPQVRARTKTVTRRLGWWDLKVGERVQLCEKCMGRKKGEPLVRLAVVEVVSTRPEPLIAIAHPETGPDEVEREGFPWWRDDPGAFVSFFLASHAKDPKTKKATTPETLVNRIEWRFV